MTEILCLLRVHNSKFLNVTELTYVFALFDIEIHVAANDYENILTKIFTLELVFKHKNCILFIAFEYISAKALENVTFVDKIDVRLTFNIITG